MASYELAFGQVQITVGIMAELNIFQQKVDMKDDKFLESMRPSEDS